MILLMYHEWAQEYVYSSIDAISILSPTRETYVILERDSLISVAQTQRFLFFAEQHLNELIGAQCQADPCLGGPPRKCNINNLTCARLG